MRTLAVALAVILLTACGGGSKASAQSQGRKTTLVYQDPAFLDGTPIPGEAITRKLYCGVSPDKLAEITLPGRRVPLSTVMAQASLPFNTPVYCIGTAEVAGVAGAPSERVNFQCKRAGANVICFEW